MPEGVDPLPIVPSRRRRPWTVTVATCLVLAATALGLLMAVLTLVIVDSSMAKGAIAQMESGLSASYDEHSLDENLLIVKVGIGLWVVINLSLAAVALAAGAGRVLAFRTLLVASMVVFFMACCCCQGPLIDCPMGDTCGEQRSGFPTWYFATMAALAWAQIGAWLSGIALFALPTKSKAYLCPLIKRSDPPYPTVRP